MRPVDALKRQYQLHAIERFSKHGSVQKIIKLMLWGYFDEAGHFRSGGDYLCMAGYFGDDTAWTGFSEAWGSLLRKHLISAVHMREMIALQGQYGKLGWTHEHRDKAVLPEFIKVIKDHLALGLGVAVDLKYFRSMPKEAKDAIGDLTYLCFMRMVRLVIDTTKKVGINFPVALIFDDSEEYSIKCYRLLTRVRQENADVKARIGSISFADDEIYYPLQAADLLAYESLKELQQKAGGYKSREHFNNLVTTDEFGLQYDSHFYDQTALDQMAAQILSK